METWERLRTPPSRKAGCSAMALSVFIFKGCPIPWKASVDLWELALESGVTLFIFSLSFILERQWGYLCPSDQAPFRDSARVPLSVGHRLNFVLLYLQWKRKLEALPLSHIHQVCAAFAPSPPPSVCLLTSIYEYFLFLRWFTRRLEVQRAILG